MLVTLSTVGCSQFDGASGLPGACENPGVSWVVNIMAGWCPPDDAILAGIRSGVVIVMARSHCDGALIEAARPFRPVLTPLSFPAGGSSVFANLYTSATRIDTSCDYVY